MWARAHQFLEGNDCEASAMAIEACKVSSSKHFRVLLRHG